jgi:hypothetical protein
MAQRKNFFDREVAGQRRAELYAPFIEGGGVLRPGGTVDLTPVFDLVEPVFAPAGQKPVQPA